MPERLPGNSLFRLFDSLFGRKNSLFCCLGNFAEKARKSSGLDYVGRRSMSEIRENSLFFPCLTGKSAETGSLETARTARHKPLL
jgi:hypothetical protein